MSIETFDNADVDWELHTRRQESSVWRSGPWQAEICRTSHGKQLDARLHLAPDAVTVLDSVTIEPEQIPPLMTFETFEADMLDRFAGWIAKNGREAMGDAPITFKIQTRHAHTLFDAAEDLISAALNDQDTDLAAALIALRSALERRN